MVSTQSITQVVPLVNVSGVWRISGTRVPLDSILFAFNEGAKPEEIVERFPSVALADVYAVIAYYLRNRDEVDNYLAARAAQRDEFESRHDQSGLLDRLLARRNNP
jgi:uncharacterized protein (DUF433 family)